MYFRLSAAIHKEWLLIWNDPNSRRMILIMPSLQVFIFAFAVNMEVTNVNLALLNLDNGQWSQEFVQRVNAAAFVAELVPVRSTQQFSELVDERAALALLQIPDNFSARIEAGELASIQVLTDGRRANSGQIVISYLSDIARQLNADVRNPTMNQALSGGVQSRVWFNPNLEYRWFVVTGLCALLSLMVVFMMTGLSIAREREMGTFDQVLVSPLSPTEIILSKTIPAIFSGGFISFIVVVIAENFFAVPFRGSLIYLALGLLVFQIAIVGLGLTLSTLTNSQQQAFLCMFSCMIPVMLTSGFMTPVDNMPAFLQVVAEFNPLRHALVLVQGLFLKAMTFKQFMDLLTPLLLIATASLSMAIGILRVRLN